MNEEEMQRRARRRANARLGVHIHASVYFCVVGAALLAQHFLAPGFRWGILPMLGWGLGLAIHAGVVLLSGPLREKLVAEELARLRRQKS